MNIGLSPKILIILYRIIKLHQYFILLWFNALAFEKVVHGLTIRDGLCKIVSATKTVSRHLISVPGYGV